MAEDEANGLRTRIAVLEARVNLIALGLKGVVGIIAAAAVKFFFFPS